MITARFSLDALDPNDPFEIDDQVAHLFKHGPLGVADIYEVWASRPGFYPAKPPADWIMVAQVHGRYIAVPLAQSRKGTLPKCRPIGCYPAPTALVLRFRGDQ